MENKKKNIVKEPADIYEVSKKDELVSNELNPVLIQMLQIGLKQIELNHTKPHHQVMEEMKRKYNFK